MLGTIEQLAARHGGVVRGDGDIQIVGVAPLAQAGPGDLGVLTHSRYLKDLPGTSAGAVLTDERLAARVTNTTVWAHPRPRAALARLLGELPPPDWAAVDRSAEPAVHESAVVDPRAELGPDVRVGPLVVVDARAVVGAGTILGARSFVGEGTRVGCRCEVGPGAMVLAGCVLGDRVRLGPGAVVGGDGFGFVPGEDGAAHLRMPQRGIAVLEDDVELGALAAVDRATLGETRVRRGTKIDNLVQVGHNCDVGPFAVIAAQSGLAGSVRIGAGALLGGQSGVGDHLEVGSGARLAAKSGVTGDVGEGETVAGYPALPHAEWLRAWGWLRRAIRGPGGRK